MMLGFELGTLISLSTLIATKDSIEQRKYFNERVMVLWIYMNKNVRKCKKELH